MSTGTTSRHIIIAKISVGYYELCYSKLARSTPQTPVYSLNIYRNILRWHSLTSRLRHPVLRFQDSYPMTRVLLVLCLSFSSCAFESLWRGIAHQSGERSHYVYAIPGVIPSKISIFRNLKLTLPVNLNERMSNCTFVWLLTRYHGNIINHINLQYALIEGYILCIVLHKVTNSIQKKILEVSI